MCFHNSLIVKDSAIIKFSLFAKTGLVLLTMLRKWGFLAFQKHFIQHQTLRFFFVKCVIFFYLQSIICNSFGPNLFIYLLNSFIFLLNILLEIVFRFQLPWHDMITNFFSKNVNMSLMEEKLFKKVLARHTIMESNLIWNHLANVVL